MAITVSQNQAGTQTTTASGSYSVAATSFTPASGDLMLAYVGIFDCLTGSASCTGGDVTWTKLLDEDGSGGLRDGFAFGATATAATAVVVSCGYSASATGGYAFIRAFAIQGHGGFGTVTSTFVETNSSLVVGTIPHGASSAIFAGHVSSQPDSILPTTFTGAGSLSSLSVAGGTLAHYVAHNLDIGASGTASVQWGTVPGTLVARRRLMLIEVLPTATVTFNYNLLEHRVMRGAGRGLMRGVA